MGYGVRRQGSCDIAELSYRIGSTCSRRIVGKMCICERCREELPKEPANYGNRCGMMRKHLLHCVCHSHCAGHAVFLCGMHHGGNRDGCGLRRICTSCVFGWESQFI
uniref:Uncharacterized protein n=1 Tax=Trypanosoma congolense (strain IL3000) TaxID=1068625 RepID=G0UU65_TRYCI|nr:hypothetical protein, unlikely [Trypanosoma congolense IL3000]